LQISFSLVFIGLYRVSRTVFFIFQYIPNGKKSSKGNGRVLLLFTEIKLPSNKILVKLIFSLSFQLACLPVGRSGIFPLRQEGLTTRFACGNDKPEATLTEPWGGGD
jgi:hypothetical protein